MKLIKGITYALLAIVVAAVAIYAASPWLLARWVPLYLESQGVDRSTFASMRPGLDGWLIERVTLGIGAIDIDVAGIDIRYRMGALLGGRMQAIDIASVMVRIEPSDDPLILEVPPLWSLIPADHLAVRRLEIDNRVPAARIGGEFALDPARARADLQIESSLLPAPLDARVMLEPEGGLELALAQRGTDTRALLLTGVPDGAGAIAVDGTIDVAGETFALLAGLAGFDGARGHVRGQVQGTAPWPLAETIDWAAVRANGSFDLDLREVSAPLADGDTISGQLSFAVAAGRATVSTPALELKAASVEWEGERNTIGAGSVLTLAADMSLPWPLGEPIDWNAVRAAGSLDVVLVDALPFADGDSLTGELTFTLDAGRAVAKVPSLLLKARALSWDGARYDFDDTSTFTVSADVATPWPLPDTEPFAPIGITARADVAVAMTSESATAIASWGNVTAGVDIALAAGVATITLDEGGSVELGIPAINELAIEARAPVVLRWRSADDSIEAKEIALNLRVPELSVLDQRLALRSARVDFARLRLAGSDLALQAKLQTRSASQALPVHLGLAMNLEKMTGRFDVRSEGKITKALLKTELSGWRTDYDLDRGELKADFAGAFRLPDDGLQVEGEGRVKLIDGIAHYGDTVLDRVNLDLPVRLAPAGLGAGPATVRIGAVDPGVPVTDVEFGVRLDPQIAELSAVGATLLGGRAGVDRIAYDLEAGMTTFAVKLESIQLKDVLALEGEDFVGDGVLDGLLPIRIDDAGLVVSAGRIEARPPGGRLSYRGNLAAPAPGLDLAITALRNFQYGGLTADVDYAANGVLTLSVKLQGRSPDVEKGRPINFNLNITEDIPALLESLRAAESITDRVQQRFSQ